MYHSIHDTYYYVKDFGDPSFSHNKALGEVWFKAALHLSTTPIIPFGVVEYGGKLEELSKALNASVFAALKPQNITLGEMVSAANKAVLHTQDYLVALVIAQEGHQMIMFCVWASFLHHFSVWLSNPLCCKGLAPVTRTVGCDLNSVFVSNASLGCTVLCYTWHCRLPVR